MPLGKNSKLALMLLLVAASLAMSGYSFYLSFRPKIVERPVDRVVEKIVEKPADRIVERIVPKCPKAPAPEVKNKETENVVQRPAAIPEKVASPVVPCFKGFNIGTMSGNSSITDVHVKGGLPDCSTLFDVQRMEDGSYIGHVKLENEKQDDKTAAPPKQP